MKNEKLLHIILAVLVAVEGVTMVLHQITEKDVYNIIFTIASGIFVVLFIISLVKERKKDDESVENNNDKQ